jgi:hypothetical protein
MSERIVTRKVELSNGETVTVYPIPQKVYDLTRKKHPYPPVPIVEIGAEDTATGETMRVAKESDPEYKRQCAEVDHMRIEDWAEGQLLWGLRDVKPPKDWEPPAEMLRYMDPNWQPRKGELGRKLDYIEWDLLQNAGDMIKVQRAINELTGIDEEAAETVEETFPDSVAGDAA